MKLKDFIYNKKTKESKKVYKKLLCMHSNLSIFYIFDKIN